MSLVPSPATVTSEELAAEPVATSGPSRHCRRYPWQPAVVAGVLVVAVSVNLWWVATHRRGLPYDIDEAGYLQRAVRDADALHSGGVLSLWSTVRLPDPQAPLLTVVAGVFHWVTGTGVLSMFAVQQVFYVVLVVATYLGSRRLMNRGWSVVAAVMVSGLPGVVIASRSFFFALPAAAMMTATLVAELYSDSFRSRWLSALWGLFLGLSALSRTVVLALVPALIAPAFVVLVLSRSRRRQLANVGLGLVVALVVAGSWYSATWHEVLHYLTGFGYGTEAGHYGAGRSIVSFAWWTNRLDLALNAEVFAPMALALALCFAAGLLGLRRRHRSPERTDDDPVVDEESPVRRALQRRDAPLWVFVGLGYLALSTSQNSGSMFELPLLPATCILAASVASRAPRRARASIAAACVIAAVVSFAGVSAAIPGLPQRSVVASAGPLHVVAFDDRGHFLDYASSTGGGCRLGGPCDRSGTMPGESAYLRRWIVPSERMASVLHVVAAEHDCDPVVFFAVQDPLFNTNTVDLSYQLVYAKALPTGVFKAPRDVGESALHELNDPADGQPNLVITGPVSAVSPRFLPLVNERAGVRALREDGFAPIGRLGLPDGRTMRVWWLDRAPCGR
jgi:4-amino-4-deoxy-L-arabinose transferase-like glycosyltransferase